MRFIPFLILFVTGLGHLSAQSVKPANVQFDIIIRNGLIYDGSGQPPIPGDVGIRGDR
ncbi:hypothetical protein [Spirosoma telluris]|uniref:hypothetical protein n=1 Tax=Spirosoma telluris TaxID=2183553 RepID=UPI0018DD7208